MGRARGKGRMRVEDCLVFDGVVLRKTGVFRSNYGSRWSYTCQRPGGISVCKLDYTVVELPGVAMGLRLEYEVSDGVSMTKRPMNYFVEVTSRRCQFGGLQFLFQCPLVVNGVPCERTVMRLYLPPGGQIFGCRHCYDLRYQDSQTHDRRVDVLMRDPLLLQSALQSSDIKLAMLGVTAVTKLARRANRRRRSAPHSPYERDVQTAGNGESPWH